MKINGIEGMTYAQVFDEVERGGSFVYFHYCISLFIITLRRSSGIYFIKAGHSTSAKGLPFTLLSLVMGWWGLPWGPIRTVQCIVTNSQGGKNVTTEVLKAIMPAAPPRAPGVAGAPPNSFV